jgi:uncharacterized membrane protein (UPF0127 family)
MQTVVIKKKTGSFGNFEKLEVWYLKGFFERLRGLMFTKQISNTQGALFINGTENIIDSAIHMLFMKFDIAVFWINSTGIIVDKTIAIKWNPIYYPKVKACKILETHIEIFDKLNVGEQIIFENL